MKMLSFGMLYLLIHILIATACVTIDSGSQQQHSKYLTLNSTWICISLENIRDDVSFVTAQAHSQWKSIMMSSNEDHSDIIEDTDVGMVSLLDPHQGNVSWYLKSASNVTINALVIVSQYSSKDPIPGACNEEFDLENDPNIVINNQHQQNIVTFQLANFGHVRGKPADNCAKPNYHNAKDLKYSVYRYVLSHRDFEEESLFSSIEKMGDVKRITQYAEKIMEIDPTTGQKTELSFAGSIGRGVIYVVTVTQTYPGNVTYTVPYVTSATYSCNVTTGECAWTDAGHITMKVVSLLIGAVGLFICFCGHRYFEFEMFFFGYILFNIITLILLANFASYGMLGIILTSLGVGCIGGILWLTFWASAGIPVLSVLVPGITTGFFVVGILFNLTPLGALTIFSASFNFGMSFSCGCLLFMCIFLAFTRVCSIICCAITGSYVLLFGIDTFLHSSLSNVFIMSLWKCSQPGYIAAYTSLPYQLEDILLLTAWGILAAAGIAIQIVRERGRPEFPPHFRLKERIRRAQTGEPSSGIVNDDTITNDVNQGDFGTGEAPLLDNTHSVST